MTIRDQLRILIDALKQWKCPSCGGTRRYRGYSKNAPNGGPCRKCAQTEGLHETAFEEHSWAEWDTAQEAIAKAEGK